MLSLASMNVFLTGNCAMPSHLAPTRHEWKQRIGENKGEEYEKYEKDLKRRREGEEKAKKRQEKEKKI